MASMTACRRGGMVDFLFKLFPAISNADKASHEVIKWISLISIAISHLLLVILHPAWLVSAVQFFPLLS